MLWEKTGLFWKNGLITVSVILMSGVWGCSETLPEKPWSVQIENETQDARQDTEADADNMTGIYMELYKEAAGENRAGDLENVRNIVNYFGGNGYVAIDSRNQIDMTAHEQVVRFCEQAESQKDAAVTIIEVSWSGGFTKYDLKAGNGNIEITQTSYQYDGAQLKNMGTESYNVDSWDYTEEGYLMFSGTWLSEVLYAYTVSDAEEYKAFRVQPLDEKYRELNRQYVLPIGYENNNMFIVDWSEDDFGELNFYDMYDILYQKVKTGHVPYAAEENLENNTCYRIPKDGFEGVIMEYFNIDSETLQSKTDYNPEDSVYEYRPRGCYEVEYPEYPYPEVVGFTENSDGTSSLTVNVVFPYGGVSKVYAHELVVRPLEDEGVQYVSNKIISAEDNAEETWHTPRLSMEEWKKMYGDG